MKFQNMFAVAGMALLTMTPFAVKADNAGKAADACIQAFVDTHVPKGRTVRVRKAAPAASPLHHYAREYTVSLSARLARSGTELVTARCVVSDSGEVIALERQAL